MVYNQYDQNSCCLSSLSSALKSQKELFNENETATPIFASMAYEVHAYSDIIKILNTIIVDKASEIGKQNIC